MFRFWADAHRRRFDLVKIGASFFGIDLSGTKSVKTPVEAVTVIENPLASFPDDISYFTKSDVAEKLRHAEIVKKRKPNVYNRGLWTKERANACLGNNKIAKRASMNDLLWERYSELITQGVDVTLNHLKLFLEVDIARSRLYPDVVELTERNRYERKNKLPLTKKDVTKPPPDWHIEKLKTTGELKRIINDIRRVSNGRQTR